MEPIRGLALLLKGAPLCFACQKNPLHCSCILTRSRDSRPSSWYHGSVLHRTGHPVGWHALGGMGACGRRAPAGAAAQGSLHCWWRRGGRPNPGGDPTRSLLVQYAPIEYITLPLGKFATSFTQFLVRRAPPRTAAPQPPFDSRAHAFE